MDAERVIEVVGALRGDGVALWMGGGWGVDALVGRQTRAHADLDLSFRDTDEGRALARLAELGFVEVLDERPTRFVLRDSAGREIDMHPVAFGASGDGVQTLYDGSPLHYPAPDLVAGSVGGVAVPCISARLQLAFHAGYEHKEKDLADLAVLDAAGRGPAERGV